MGAARAQTLTAACRKRVECHVCSGVGLVDRVRRGGTDDRNEYVPKRKPGK